MTQPWLKLQLVALTNGRTAKLWVLHGPRVSADHGVEAAHGKAEWSETISNRQGFAIKWLLLLPLPTSLFATNLTAAGLTPTPFAEVGCAFAQSRDDPSWLWQAGEGTFYSCNMPVRGDIGSMCVDSNGQPDYTSLYVDLKTARRKSGCFAWLASSCAMDFRRMQRIEFDFDVKSCGSVWAAPLWISPEPWHWPGGTSGEVDLVEPGRERLAEEDAEGE
eukprot:Skav210763  [mRNA]  locus=scaffold3955:8266:15165:+ [translate_table: standard]